MVQAVSLLEKELQQGRERLPVGWPWRLLVFVLILAGLSVFIYLAMVFGYKLYLDSQVKKLDNELADLSGSFEDAKSSSIRRFYSELVNAKTLLNNHTIGTKIMGIVESSLYPSAMLTGLEIQSAERTVKISGIVSTYKDLGAEFNLLRSRPGVESAFLDESSLRDQGDIRFTMRLILSPALFKD